MPLSTLLSLENDISAKRYVSRSGFCGYCQFHRSLSDHLVKHFSHLSRGKKATTQNWTKSNTLLACLASTDLLTGLVLQPIAIAVDVNRILGVGQFCVLEKLGQIALSAAGFSSSSHLILISIDRYIAIKHPLRYQEIQCYRTPGKTSCCTCMGHHYSVFHNSRLCFNLYTEWFREIVLGLS